MVPVFYSSEVVYQWEKLLTDNESPCEVDVWPWLVNMTADVISHAAFGSSYKQGQRIFELQGELSGLIAQELGKPYIPGLSLALSFCPVLSYAQQDCSYRSLGLSFSFELSPYVHSPQIVMTTRPQFGAHLTLHKL
ncbi:hypothetical protein Rs2_26449 [Raphanus sativus]|nr:hypothetical protein Rs2_26449 [Raphanus sativus]